MAPPEIIFGTGGFGFYEGSPFNTPEKVQAAFDILQKHGTTRIDTARRYPNQNSGTCEQLLGQPTITPSPSRQKYGPCSTATHPPNSKRASTSPSTSCTSPTLTPPTSTTPTSEPPSKTSAAASTTSTSRTNFPNSGISNFTIPQIKQILQICEENSYIKPVIYQGQYNALARDAEHELLPLLRKHDIAFYAYSPGAGGFFNGVDSTRLTAQDQTGDFTRGMYGGAGGAVEKVNQAAIRHGLTGHAAALRWVLHHSVLDAERGDAVVIGARTLEQLEETLRTCEMGPLPEEMVGVVDGVWGAVKDTAPLYSMFAKREGEGENAMDRMLKKESDCCEEM
ncbi:hypothetical protein OHC33_003001 [Knufia fluminis]|uniref:NADP-dependent oxidoreductase domain-containing protein n=1 Tax=Knufia fluminis TaxID=191047 RepID=A0AAN8EIG7_9EURO|nr:hypothetical protein OHC33_003001 [Knufia fluminis]